MTLPEKVLKPKPTLWDIAKFFFPFGWTAFGGPAAHIAMMQRDIVEKRGWLSHEQFLNMVGITNIIPGPNSTEMAMHIGYVLQGIKGLFVAGILFLIPAITITAGLSWVYFEYGQLPSVLPFFTGIKPAVIAIILVAVYQILKKVPKQWGPSALGILALVASFFYSPAVILLSSLAFGLGAGYIRHRPEKLSGHGWLILFPILANLNSGKETIAASSLLNIFLSFLKIGSILYGSGYVLFAYLQSEFIAPGILSSQVIVDSVAIGQMSPGPVLSTATFVGYTLAGAKGAIVATIGIFLPSFLFVWLCGKFLVQGMKYPIFRTMLGYVNFAALAVMVYTALEIGRVTVTDWPQLAVVLASLFLLLRVKQVSNVHVLLLGGLAGYLY